MKVNNEPLSNKPPMDKKLLFLIEAIYQGYDGLCGNVFIFAFLSAGHRSSMYNGRKESPDSKGQHTG